MKKIRHIAFVLFLFALCSCGAKKQVKLFYGSGNLKAELVYESGVLNGECKWYRNSENKVLAKVQNFNFGILDGDAISYFSSGEKRVKETYSLGKKNGDYLEWYQNGAIKIKTKYADGRILGSYQAWTSKSELIINDYITTLN